ncbi:MAG: hypothetical protein ABSE70_07090 [Candidatus Limnocylindrales bacterium]
MIAPDAAAELRAERRFDLIAAILIGLIALLAAVLAATQIYASEAATRANMRAARLADDLSARISVSSQALDSAVGAQEVALALGMESASRQLTGIQHGDDATVAVGAAQERAFDKLRKALAATSDTTGNAPVDAYTRGLLEASTADLQKELAEQNRQVDLANEAGSREQRAVLGLSFLALAGVLTGLGAVLRESRAGWIALVAACAIAGGAGALAALTLL